MSNFGGKSENYMAAISCAPGGSDRHAMRTSETDLQMKTKSAQESCARLHLALLADII